MAVKEEQVEVRVNSVASLKVEKKIVKKKASPKKDSAKVESFTEKLKRKITLAKQMKEQNS